MSLHVAPIDDLGAVADAERIEAIVDEPATRNRRTAHPPMACGVDALFFLVAIKKSRDAVSGDAISDGLLQGMPARPDTYD